VIDQPEVQYHLQRIQAILPADLLPFLVSSSVIIDRHLINPKLPLGACHRYLRVEAKAVRADRYALENVGTEDLITSLHVRDGQIAEHVRDQRQCFIDQRMPERQHSSLRGGQVPRSKDSVRMTVEKRPQ